MAKQHWLDAIASEVRQRAFDAVDTVAAGIKDSVPFGGPPPAPPQMTLAQYLTADPQTRQAMLQNDPNSTDTLSRLHNEAVSRYGANAANLLPILSMEQGTTAIAHAQQQDPHQSVADAMGELQDMLGINPFGQNT